MKVKGIVLVVLGVLVISACTRGNTRGAPRIPSRDSQSAIHQLPPVTPESRELETPRSRQPSTSGQLESSPAVIALMDQSAYERDEGNLGQAVAVIERALRIQPRNPILWHRLAALRLQQGRHELAENLARKSISLARADEVLIRKNRAIIRKAQRKTTN